MKETDLVPETEHLQEQLGKEEDLREYLEGQIKEAEDILAAMAKAYDKYKRKYYGRKS